MKGDPPKRRKMSLMTKEMTFIVGVKI